jgi:hypothetical protein
VHLHVERVLQIGNVAPRAEELDAPGQVLGADEVFELLLIPLGAAHDAAGEHADRRQALAAEPIERSQEHLLAFPRLHVHGHAHDQISGGDAQGGAGFFPRLARDVMLEIEAIGRHHHTRGVDPLLQQMLADRFGHRHAGGHPLAPETVERGVADQALLVGDARDAEAPRRDHAVDVWLDAVAEVDEVGTGLLESRFEQPRAGQRMLHEMPHRPERPPQLGPRSRAPIG